MPNCSIPLLSDSECLTRFFLSSRVVGATSMSGFPFVVRVCIVRIDVQQTGLSEWLPSTLVCSLLTNAKLRNRDFVFNYHVAARHL